MVLVGPIPLGDVELSLFSLKVRPLGGECFAPLRKVETAGVFQVREDELEPRPGAGCTGHRERGAEIR